MNKKMKAVIWDGSKYPEGLSYGDFAVPEPRENWVQFRTLACGICGSDIHALTGRTRHLMPDRNFPAILGHENAGIITKLGKGVDEFKVGDRVAIEPLHGCIDFGGTCMMCRSGKYQLCAGGLNVIGMPNKDMLPGGYGEYSCAHKSHVFKISDKLSFTEAAVTDVLAVALHAVNVGDPQIGMKVIVLGAGVIGLDTVQVLKARGISNILVVARYSFQAEMALRLGASQAVSADGDIVKRVHEFTNGRGADQVYECVGGNSDTIGRAIELCAIGGKVVMVGCATKIASIDIQQMLFKEVQLLPSNSYGIFKGVSEFAAALEMLEKGVVDHKSLITGEYAPEDFRQALDNMINKKIRNTIKPVFVWK
jgi:threonine dehydrogenase-like Zn-dependent dehydrogenase